MIFANQILKNVRSHTVTKNTSYKSKITKFDGKIVECDSFPSPIGTICRMECNDKNFSTGEIIGFKENKNLIAIHNQNANLVSGSCVEVLSTSTDVLVGNNLLGRVVDAFGNPIDDNKKKLTSKIRNEPHTLEALSSSSLSTSAARTVASVRVPSSARAKSAESGIVPHRK